MRAFIALAFPQQIKDTLARVQNELKSCGAPVKWVEPNNIHLTLKFLGEISEEQTEKICAILDLAAARQNTFPLSLAGLGAFPKMQFPRVIKAGVDKGVTETKTIVKILEDKCEKIRISKEERPFSCHITLGRTRSLQNLQTLVQKIIELEGYFTLHPAEFTVEEITLFKSTLTPAGPLYEVVNAASLKAH